MDALELLDLLENVDIGMVASVALDKNSRRVEELNRDQLLEGKRADGKDITPTYLEDPYFKTKEAAQRYSDWKDEITPSSKRKKGVPNLIITGAFHGGIDFKVRNLEYDVRSTFQDADKIEQKFTEEIYFLNEEKREQLIEESLQDDTVEEFSRITGL